ncbi:hypothetical protein HW49_10365 [Porphyromonadaceae bacterium COT-184 OH4590]|nr:hypothetical protein HW49_10365 [Porphyromonadaceae bacterium COT-184 OH4590]
MASYKTPGVYVEEIPKLPQSVADVPTAIPAFIGYTEHARTGEDESADELRNKPKKIRSLIEYERYFGKYPTYEQSKDKKFVTYDSVRLFFDNGGGVCYIVSIGNYTGTEDNTPNAERFTDALKEVESIDEVTLLLMPDASTLLSADKLGSVQQQALLQCKKLGDRFAILDIKEEADKDREQHLETFRDGVGANNLEYGAAYYPHISTTYSYNFGFTDIVNKIFEDTYKKDLEKFLSNFDVPSAITLCRTIGVQKNDKTKTYLAARTTEVLKRAYSRDNIDYETVKTIWKLDDSSEKYGFKVEKEESSKAKKDKAKLYDEKFNELKETEVLKAYVKSQLLVTESYEEIVKDEAKHKEKADLFIKKQVIEDLVNEKINTKDSKYLQTFLFAINPNDKDQKVKEEALKPFIKDYGKYEQELIGKASLVPPSGAIAGIYAQNDNVAGVWKAPANMSLASIKGVSCLINNDMQDGMNIHSSGKSINAIRAFSGKGILVWGARTLKGNDNEWRYIPVRRLFNYVEESIQESTEWAVFSPNTQNTWTKIKSQIENFLTNIWRAGGLAGATPDQAFFVNVGLNSTMDAQDILDGRLIVEVGMAAVRPAEFIIIRFSHKLQES